MFSDGDVQPWINLINRNYVNSLRWTQVFVTKTWTELLDVEPQTGQASMKEVSNYPADVAPVVLFFQQTVLDCYQSPETQILFWWLEGQTAASTSHLKGLLASLVKRERSKGHACEALQRRVCHFFKGLPWCLTRGAPTDAESISKRSPNPSQSPPLRGSGPL